MAIKSWKKRVEDAKSRDSYWAERAKISFVSDLQQLMELNGISNAKLAEKLDVSAPYISKLLRGDTNLTIESMVKAVRAVDGQLTIRVSDSKCHVRWYDVYERAQQRNPISPRTWTGGAQFNSSNDMNAANDHEAEPFAA